MTSWSLYWITRLDSIQFTLAAISVVSLIAIGALAFAMIPACVEESERYMKAIPILIKKFLMIGVASLLVCCFVPSTKEMAAIIVIPQIANSQTAKELGDATVTLAREWLEELRPKKEESK